LATAAFEGLPLQAENRRIVAYWLSLWEGNLLPLRARFEPVRVRDLLPGVVIMEIKPRERVLIRLSGSAINRAFGRDITGMDILAMTPERYRATRLERNSQVAEGAASLVHRSGVSRAGEPWASEEVQLPFRDVTADGARLVLLHTTWRPPEGDGPAELEDLLAPAEEFHVIPLWRT
jgi:hypothetical protein